MGTDHRLIIFDADGTLRRSTVEGQPCPDREGEWEVLPGVREKVKPLFDAGTQIAIASNQGGVQLGYLTERMARGMLTQLYYLLTDRWPSEGLVQICPHTIDSASGGFLCACRKPLPGMILRLMIETGVARERILFVGDRPEDRAAAHLAHVDFEWAGDFFQWEWTPPESFICAACINVQDRTKEEATHRGQPASYLRRTGEPICAACHEERLKLTGVAYFQIRADLSEEIG